MLWPGPKFWVTVCSGSERRNDSRDDMRSCCKPAAVYFYSITIYLLTKFIGRLKKKINIKKILKNNKGVVLLISINGVLGT